MASIGERLSGYYTGPTITDWHGAELAQVTHSSNGPVRFTPTGGRYRVTQVIARDAAGNRWEGRGSFDWSQVITMRCTYVAPVAAVTVWANGFGVWHARVPVTSDSRRVAQRAIRRELELRGAVGKGYRVAIRPVSVDGDRVPGTVTYAERVD